MKADYRDIKIMGILNITDDSFYAPSRMLTEDGKLDVEGLRNRVNQMLLSGADILDIGACSTRPGSKAVGADLEWARLSAALPIIREIAPNTPISIDTYHASVVEKVYSMIGNFIVNDISSGRMDGRMLRVVGDRKLPYVAMHMRGTPENMQTLTEYKDGIIAEVKNYFMDFAVKADQAGIKEWYLDPGFGFAKTISQNYTLMQHLDLLQDLLHPILVGISRKSMIYNLLGQTPEDVLAPTQALHMAALERGASVLRVHDVGAARHTLVLYKELTDNAL